MAFPSSPLQKSSHGFSSPSVFQEENQSHNSSLISFAVIIILMPKKSKDNRAYEIILAQKWNPTNLVSLLRIYATAKRKVFPTKTKTLDTARARAQVEKKRTSLLWIQGPKSRSRNTCRVQMTYIVIPILGPRLGEISGPEKTLTPGLYNSKLFSPKIYLDTWLHDETWRCMTKERVGT
jgi:hypothetical protein